MKQPYEALPLQRKAQQHEATLYSGAAVRGKNLDTRKELYLRAVEANCQKLNTVVEKQRETVSDAAAGATPRSGSERRGERGEAAKYWELLNNMRKYKKFALKYVNGPLKKWIEDSQSGYKKAEAAVKELTARKETIKSNPAVGPTMDMDQTNTDQHIGGIDKRIHAQIEQGKRYKRHIDVGRGITLMFHRFVHLCDDDETDCEHQPHTHAKPLFLRN
jgi:hypothetical protein